MLPTKLVAAEAEINQRSDASRGGWLILPRCRSDLAFPNLFQAGRSRRVDQSAAVVLRTAIFIKS
jgi:hypothetical protein